MSNNSPVTQDQLNESLDKFAKESIFPTVELMLEKTEEKMEEKMAKEFNKVLNVLDHQGKILERLDTENASHHFSYTQQAEVLDDHEQRIKVLETRKAF
jgi:RecJ-like exonuclease